MNILIAGGRGFIGHHLTDFLTQQGHDITVLSRTSGNVKWNGKILETDLKFDAIINLCGQNIAAHNWSDKVKQALLNSRLDPTNAIAAFIKKSSPKKKIKLLNASAIGFYPSSQELQTEDHCAHSTDTLFSKKLVEQWESCAQQASEYNALVTCLRFGAVLGKDGGMIKKISPAFKLGLGTVMGDKSAHLSWIHIHDLCRAVAFILSMDELKPAYNITSPKSCSQAEFSKALAKAYKRPCFLTFPKRFIQKIFGQMGEELLLADQKIHPKNLVEANFQFEYPHIQKALQAL